MYRDAETTASRFFMEKSKTTGSIIIMMKNPVLGKAKTRLAKGVGAEEALRIYKLLLEKTKETVLGVKANRFQFCSYFIDQNDGWDSSDFSKRLQEGDDLGQRMFNAASSVPPGKILIIGTDCPGITSEILEQAFASLKTVDAVFGPSLDGGYYLVGMNRPLPFLFKDMEWSTESVLENSLEKCRQKNHTFSLLPRLSDIDTHEDWEKFGW